MPKIQYENWSPKTESLAMIQHANAIIAEYAAQGFDLTLRQLYYQFVSRDLIANKQSEYKRLGDLVSKGRRAGLIDWDAITDRTRNLRSLGTWDTPESIVEAVSSQFRYDRWLTQPTYIEVWFEKDALLGVFERAANEWRLPYFSCRGYTSDSEIWSAAQRLASVNDDGREIVILHFGDHDPSGIDMTRDIRDRIQLFGANVDVRRLALNMDQIEQYEPPPNPAKETDSRFEGYRQRFGDESWELDALDPTTLAEIVEREVMTLLDEDAWEIEKAREVEARAQLKNISENYQQIVKDYPV